MTDGSTVGVEGAVVSQRTSSQLRLGFSGKASWRSCFSLGLKGDAFPSASFSCPIPPTPGFSAQLLFASRSLGQRREVTSQGHTAGRWQKQDLKTGPQGTGMGASSWQPRAVCTSYGCCVWPLPWCPGPDLPAAWRQGTCPRAWDHQQGLAAMNCNPATQGSLCHHRVPQTQGLAPELVGPPPAPPSSTLTLFLPPELGGLGTHISPQEEKPQPPPPLSHDLPSDMATFPRGPLLLRKHWVLCPILGALTPRLSDPSSRILGIDPAFSSF